MVGGAKQPWYRLTDTILPPKGSEARERDVSDHGRSAQSQPPLVFTGSFGLGCFGSVWPSPIGCPSYRWLFVSGFQPRSQAIVGRRGLASGFQMGHSRRSASGRSAVRGLGEPPAQPGYMFSKARRLPLIGYWRRCRRRPVQSSVVSNVSTMRAADGMVASSRMSADGRGMWSVVILTIGASRS